MIAHPLIAPRLKKLTNDFWEGTLSSTVIQFLLCELTGTHATTDERGGHTRPF
jgi:hypothetical protein